MSNIINAGLVFLLICILDVSTFKLRADETVTVSVAQGQLRGRLAATINKVTYYSFQGIPYAKPPVGSLRFKAPQPADPWEGIRDALTEGSICAQIPGLGGIIPTDEQVHVGEEDCLFLNVYTTVLPSSSSENLKPVMVWIHGGGYSMGSGNYQGQGPDFLLEDDVIVVSINYRLDAFGFLSTGDSVIPGNNGMKDQVMALHWVQQNIAQFGGDPNDVTIFGESAGGSSVHLLTLSPMAKGLFHKVIAMSGSALSPWAYHPPEKASQRTITTCKALGLDSEDSNEILEFLTSLPVEDILRRNVTATPEQLPEYLIFFRPTHEISNGEESFLTEEPLNIIKKGEFNQVYFMSGTVSEEGILVMGEVLLNLQLISYYNEHFELLIPEDLNIDHNSELGKEIAANMKELYFKEKNFTWRTAIQMINFFTDIMWLHPALTHSVLQSASSTFPVYQYRMSFKGRWGVGKNILGDVIPGVIHGDDLHYIFYQSNLDYSDYQPEIPVHRRMVKLFTNFAKTGNPTPEADPLLQNVTWSPTTQEDHYSLEIGNNLSLERDIKKEYMDFWDQVYSNCHSEEEGFLFYYPVSFNVSDGPEIDTVKRMVGLWTNFAKTGNPTSEPDPVLQNVTWSPVTELDHFYLDIGNDLILRRDLQNDHMAFWRNIYLSFNA